MTDHNKPKTLIENINDDKLEDVLFTPEQNDNIDNINEENVMHNEISSFLSKIQNKYSGNAEQKHLNQMYDIGIMIANKEFNQQKLVQKLTKIINERSRDPIKKIRDHKRQTLLEALKKGVDDGMSEEYRLAYDSSSNYRYNIDRLKKRAHIDSVLDSFKQRK